MIMLTIGDRVRHKSSGLTGTIIGYGYQKISESYYLTTLKVQLPTYSYSYSPIEPIAEDLFDRWQIWHERILACSLPHPTNYFNR